MSKESYFQYDQHQAEWDKVLTDPVQGRLGDTWLTHNTLDAWRHKRMHVLVEPILEGSKEARWLTVGDGRYGTDAHYLLTSGITKVHCSDISDTLLKIGNEKGFIGEFSAQNAESLKFEDSSFDFVYCKEALHHFPRPYMALYEMLRVCKTAVILTEPRDQILDRAPLGFFLKTLKKVLRKNQDQHSFEAVGNYVYSISERELSKFLLGMHYTYIGFNGCNDYYIPGVEFIEFNPKNLPHKWVKLKTFMRIAIMDILCFLGIMKTGILTVALFKESPSSSLIKSMSSGGWIIKELPKNPYI